MVVVVVVVFNWENMGESLFVQIKVADWIHSNVLCLAQL